MSVGKAHVYALQHSATGKIYVGCTRDVERRVTEHLKQLLTNSHPNKQMQDDFNQQGGEFFYYVLFSAGVAYDAFKMEKHFMSLLGTRDPSKGYNTDDRSKNFALSTFKRCRAVKLLRKENNQMALRWQKSGRSVTPDGTTITYTAWQGCKNTGVTIESRKRHIPHANNVGTWDHTSFFVLKDGKELTEKQSLAYAKTFAEEILGCLSQP